MRSSAPGHASETLEWDALSGRLCVSPPAWALVSLFLAAPCTISPPWLLIYCPRRGNLSSSLCNQCVTTDLRSPMQNPSSIIADNPTSVICNLQFASSQSVIETSSAPPIANIGPPPIPAVKAINAISCLRQLGSVSACAVVHYAYCACAFCIVHAACEESTKLLDLAHCTGICV